MIRHRHQKPEILSFHPCVETDKNILCAGREPWDDDLAAIKAADAVILPQGCRESLYKMAHNNCDRVFPNYDAKFRYPGKIAQIQLFRETGVPHPKTDAYLTYDEFIKIRSREKILSPGFYNFLNINKSLPFIFKFAWGGEGDNVFLIRSYEEFKDALHKAVIFEKTGQSGFLVQEYIPSGNRTLRVVIIGKKILSYWRVQENPEDFCSNLARGGVIDPGSDPDLQAEARTAVRYFCRKTGINLAGFDLLFSELDSERTPLFLEINYFFGRSGLGGSEKFYELLNTEIRKWIDDQHLNLMQ
ncbi:hypothetical protein QUF80_19520 [Desulfococcaceae bacterium HSG8]|nr:hypothetical protein [Desulfococcaceae bacterium HSG8]